MTRAASRKIERILLMKKHRAIFESFTLSEAFDFMLRKGYYGQKTSRPSSLDSLKKLYAELGYTYIKTAVGSSEKGNRESSNKTKPSDIL